MDMNSMEWLPVVGYPGYEVSGYGLVCKIRRDGSRELLVSYRDRQPDRFGNRWVYVTLWKNYQPRKVALREIIKSTWVPELEKRNAQKSASSVAAAVSTSQSRKDDDEKNRRLMELVDGYNPHGMSATGYMKYLRDHGHKFRTCILAAELAKKKRAAFGEEVNELF